MNSKQKGLETMNKDDQIKQLQTEVERLREELSAQKVITESYMSERDRYKELVGERLETLADVEQERQSDVAALVEALERITTWPDGGRQYGQLNIQKFAAEALAAYRKQEGEELKDQLCKYGCEDVTQLVEAHKQAEQERDQLKAQINSLKQARKERDFLIAEYERAVGCGAQGFAHAAGHLFNAIMNAKADINTEHFLALRDERDALNAQNNQLRTALRAMNSHLNYIPALDLTVDEVLTMSLNQSLAAHDAEVIERARAYVTSEVRESDLAEHYDLALAIYANRLRQKAKEVKS